MNKVKQSRAMQKLKTFAVEKATAMRAKKPFEYQKIHYI
jgi:hypothetical protein